MKTNKRYPKGKTKHISFRLDAMRYEKFKRLGIDARKVFENFLDAI